MDFARRPSIVAFVVERTQEDEEAVDAAVANGGLDDVSLAYMAPEQLAAESWTASADLYALGAILSRLGSRAPLFADELTAAPEGNRWRTVQNQLLAGGLSPWSAMCISDAKLPQPIVELASKCIAQTARKRPNALLCKKSLEAQEQLLDHTARTHRASVGTSSSANFFTPMHQMVEPVALPAPGSATVRAPSSAPPWTNPASGQEVQLAGTRKAAGANDAKSKRAFGKGPKAKNDSRQDNSPALEEVNLDASRRVRI